MELTLKPRMSLWTSCLGLPDNWEYRPVPLTQQSRCFIRGSNRRACKAVSRKSSMDTWIPSKRRGKARSLAKTSPQLSQVPWEQKSSCFYICPCIRAGSHTWRPDKNVQELAFSLHHVTLKDWTKVLDSTARALAHWAIPMVPEVPFCYESLLRVLHNKGYIEL